MENLIQYYDKRRKRSYFFNPITEKSQWPLHTYKDKKTYLPKGWVRLRNSDGTFFYKFIGYKKVSNSRSSYYSPEDEEKEIIMSSYKSLSQSSDPRARKELHRRNDLLLSLANLLGIESSSIGDESLEYLVNKFKKSVETIMQKRQEEGQILESEDPLSFIIKEIERLEKQELGSDKCKLTSFKTIQQEDPEKYTKERSIRELLGVNMREREAEEALNEINNLQCPATVDGEIMKDPVRCSSGITFERSAIERWFDITRTCPITKKPITNVFVPDQFARKIIDAFAEKYKDQQGDLWKSIRETCKAQIAFVNGNQRKNPPIRQAPESQPPQPPQPPQIRQAPYETLSGQMRRLAVITDSITMPTSAGRRAQRREREAYDQRRLALGEGSGTNDPETQSVDQYLEQLLQNPHFFEDQQRVMITVPGFGGRPGFEMPIERRPEDMSEPEIVD